MYFILLTVYIYDVYVCECVDVVPGCYGTHVSQEPNSDVSLRLLLL